jgi:twin BRCT domain/BRCA1 C Terminus (BRCT) domain
MALEGKVICLTGFRRDDIESIKTVIASLGGKLTNSLTRDTYCLILSPDSYGSEKYIAASKNKIFIVTLAWLEECHRTKSLVNIDEYKANIFTGLLLTCSGIARNTRTQMIDLITTYGGTYRTDLNPDEITHLICQSPNSEKYDLAATVKSIKIVQPKWVYDSIQQNSKILKQI